MVGSLFDLEDLRDGEFRPLSNLSSVLFRNLAELRHCLAGEHFNFQPDLKLSLVRPDFAHLRPGITIDHARNIEGTVESEKRFRPGWPRIQPYRGPFLDHVPQNKSAEDRDTTSSQLSQTNKNVRLGCL